MRGSALIKMPTERALHSLLTVCTCSNLCRATETNVNLGFSSRVWRT
jgi:hypothetical protein